MGRGMLVQACFFFGVETEKHLPTGLWLFCINTSPAAAQKNNVARLPGKRSGCNSMARNEGGSFAGSGAKSKRLSMWTSNR